MKTSIFKNLDLSDKEIIDYRLKVIKLFDKYGEESVKEIFGVSRSTVFLWKQKLKKTKWKFRCFST